MTGRTVYILGGGGHAHVIASFLDHPDIRFVTPEPAAAGEMSQAEFFAASWDPGAIDVYLGVGDNAGRRRLFDKLHAIGLKAAVCIAPNAFVARDAQVGEGSVICAGAVIGSRAEVGCNVIVNTLSVVDHDCRVGDDVQIAGGVTLGGRVTIGARAFLGLKCGVIPDITIGEDVTVLAGSLVNRSVAPGLKAGGSPARVIGRTAAAGEGRPA